MAIRIEPDPKTKAESGHCLRCGVSLLWTKTRGYAHPKASCPYCGNPLGKTIPAGANVWRSIDGAAHAAKAVPLLPSPAADKLEVKTFGTRRAKLQG